jgi:hypothetical protein
MKGGVTVPCYEAAAAVVARIEEELKGDQPPAAPHEKESSDGDGSD